jgi:hypothetical protein
MIPFETCIPCIQKLSDQSELLITLYLQVCMHYVRGMDFIFNDAYDAPTRGLIKRLENQGYVISTDIHNFTHVHPLGRYLMDMPEEHMVIWYFCVCGRHEKGESN